MTNIISDKLEIIADLCASYHVMRLELFGSAAKGDFFQVPSDIDFIVEFKKLSPTEHADAFFGLMEELQQVFERPIDLVERKAIRNPYFLQAIDQDRIEIYADA